MNIRLPAAMSAGAVISRRALGAAGLLSLAGGASAATAQQADERLQRDDGVRSPQNVSD